MGRTKKVPNFVKERIAKQQAAKDKKRAAWLQAKVYGGRGGPSWAEGPSTSVRTVGGGFESNRRRH